MELFHTVREIKEAIGKAKNNGKKVGFVPTMGALHQGHLSLVDIAAKSCDVVVVSIFVNPTQFNNANDLKSYPRDLQYDLDLLQSTTCSMVFAPSVKEVYPEADNRQFSFGNLDKVMEGEHRPGHFNGVAQVVSKLFDMVEPHMAFFGLKDFQQLAVIKSLVKQTGSAVEIVACPIIREQDGLAMSSRNMLLSAEQRINAAYISKVLFEAVDKEKIMGVAELRAWVVEKINKNPYLTTEYFEVVDDENLLPVTDWDQNCNKVGCIAVHCGQVRLIDNVIF